MTITDDDKRFSIPPAKLAKLDANEKGMGKRLQDFLRTHAQPIGVVRRITDATIFLDGSVGGRWPLAAINLADARVYFSYLMDEAEKRGRGKEFTEKYAAACRALAPPPKKGDRSCYLSQLLQAGDAWAVLMEDFLNAVRTEHSVRRWP